MPTGVVVRHLANMNDLKLAANFIARQFSMTHGNDRTFSLFVCLSVCPPVRHVLCDILSKRRRECYNKMVSYGNRIWPEPWKINP